MAVSKVDPWADERVWTMAAVSAVCWGVPWVEGKAVQLAGLKAASLVALLGLSRAGQ